MINIAKQLKSLPNSHGIYLFYNSKKELLYVGKATSLRSRVRSYFTSPQPPPSKGEGGNQSLSPYEGESWREVSRPIESMIHQVTKIKTIKTDSVLEAIIFEGNYIKKFRPKYNVDWKDDKSWNYLAITNDKFPRLIAVRQHELNSLKHKNIKTLKQKNNKTNYSLPITHYSLLFGPFPSLNTRETIKILHKLFYISRCSPPYQGGALRASEGGGKKSKPCFDYQLGHCLGVCTGEITAQEYRQKVIRPLTEFLNGHKKRLLSSLKKQMALSSRQQNFEEAIRLRNQIKSLSHIQDVTLLNSSLFNNFQFPNSNFQINSKSQNLNNKKIRIEAYDISNLGPTGKVGSMIVFDQNGPIKSEYRKFKIKTVAGQSDVDCLKEIITRRFQNNWPLPDLILVDGGIPQVNATKNVLQNLPSCPRRGGFREAEDRVVGEIPVIGLAKGPTRQKNEFIFDKNNQKIADFIQANENLLIQARDEAHRFAINYQKKLRQIR